MARMNVADQAFTMLRRGISQTKLWEKTGWSRKPTEGDMRNFANRRGVSLVVRQSDRLGPIFKFVA